MAVPLCLLWETWKERNRIVSEEAELLLTRIKTSFTSSVTYWAGLIHLGDCSFVRLLLCIL